MDELFQSQLDPKILTYVHLLNEEERDLLQESFERWSEYHNLD